MCIRDSILGATEFICPDMPPSLQEKLQQLSQTNRVLLLAWTDQPVQPGILPPQITPVGFILLQDNLRTAVQQTLAYFTKQDINLKVISGDNAYTVSNIAHQAGVPNWQNYICLLYTSQTNLRATAGRAGNQLHAFWI